MSSPVRSFVAIQLSPEAKSAVLAARDQLKSALEGVPVKWGTIDNVHITLRFLGHIGDERMTLLEEILDSIAREHKKFSLTTGQPGAFPSLKSPIVLWVGLRGDLSALNALQEDIEKGAGTLATHEENKGYHPHITLARCPGLTRELAAKVGAALSETVLPEIVWEVSSFELMRSVLNPKGASYSVLQECGLA